MILNSETILCPACNTENEIQIFSSINISLVPELKDKVVDGTIFKMKCHKCNETTFINYPCLLNDMTNQIIIQSFCGLNANEVKNIVKDFVNIGYTIRLVDDNTDLCEKARIFNLGLNDYAIEFFKLVIFNQTKNEHNLGKIVFEKLVANNGQKELLFSTENENITISILFEDYENKEKDFYVHQQLDKLRQEYEVSWQKLFKRHGIVTKGGGK